MRARSSLSGERGAIIIQVAVSLLVLMSFMVFVLDYGVLWVARGEAQNAADAGALAGAVSRAYDEFANPPAPGGITELAAKSAAASHQIFGQSIPPDTVAVSYNCPPGVTGGGCVQVDVFRNGQNGSTGLPVFFAPLLGITSQGTRATATAQALAANAVNCLKPWAVMDRWADAQDNPWTQASIYAPSTGDTYVPPYPGLTTTGFSNRDANGNPVDAGRQMILKMNHPGQQNPQVAQWGGGWALALDLPPPPGGGNPYQRNITGCTTATVSIAAQNETCSGGPNPAIGCINVEPGAMGGGNGGPTWNGVQAIIASDPGAYWDSATNSIAGSSFAGGLSPRVVPLALVDPHHYVTQPNANGNNGIVKVVNFVGFFVEGICPSGGGGGGGNQPPFPIVPMPDGPGQCQSGSVIGRLVSFPGEFIVGGTAPTSASFGQVIRLVR